MNSHKPYLVRLAEFICRYTDKSSELQRDFQLMTTEVERLETELKKSNDRIATLKKDLLDSSTLVLNLKEQLEFLLKTKADLTSKCELLQNENASLRGQVENIEPQMRSTVGDLIACIKNAEVLSTPHFDKEKSISFFCNQIETILKDVIGISIYEDVDVPFNPTFHKIVATIPADDPSKIGLISRSYSKGFRQGDKCILEQQVEIYE